jgi:hypothetical protein
VKGTGRLGVRNWKDRYKELESSELCGLTVVDVAMYSGLNVVDNKQQRGNETDNHHGTPTTTRREESLCNRTKI